MSTTVKQLKEVPGIISCVLEHEVTKTKATFKWEGPMIQPLVWQQMLAFFKWTHDEYKSESQVRLFVNHKTREWAAWAFPQEAKTGMTAKELDTDETKKQRAQFSDTEGWLYFGTVHHHCGASAFQSSVDEANEKSQDGLHITIGKMYDVKLYDMHCRLYISGHKFEPKMSWFWDTEPFFSAIPEDKRMFLVDGVEDRIARLQMCQPAPKEVEFPGQWKENVIEIKPVITTTYAGGLGYKGGLWGDDNYNHNWERSYSRSNKTTANTKRDLYIASVELKGYFAKTKHEAEKHSDPIKTLEGLLDVPWLMELFDNFYRNDVSIGALIKFMLDEEQREIEEELEAQQEKKQGKVKHKKGKGNGNQDNGIPTYEGLGGYAPGMLPE